MNLDTRATLRPDVASWLPLHGGPKHACGRPTQGSGLWRAEGNEDSLSRGMPHFEMRSWLFCVCDCSNPRLYLARQVGLVGHQAVMPSSPLPRRLISAFQKNIPQIHLHCFHEDPQWGAARGVCWAFENCFKSLLRVDYPVRILCHGRVGAGS